MGDPPNFLIQTPSLLPLLTSRNRVSAIGKTLHFQIVFWILGTTMVLYYLTLRPLPALTITSLLRVIRMHWLRAWPVEPDSPSSNCSSSTVMAWVPQKADSESRVLEYWRVIRECSWDQLLWKEKEISRIGLREKLSCNVISVKACVNPSGFWSWDGPSELSWEGPRGLGSEDNPRLDGSLQPRSFPKRAES